jgi:hypothetical protein
MRHIRLTATFAAIALPFAASLAGCGTTQTASQTKIQATPQQQRGSRRRTTNAAPLQ